MNRKNANNPRWFLIDDLQMSGEGFNALRYAVKHTNDRKICKIDNCF